MIRRAARLAVPALFGGLLVVSSGCDADDASRARETAVPSQATPRPARAPSAASASAAASAIPDDLPRALVLALARFAPRDPSAKGLPKALPAAMQFISRRGGRWIEHTVEDPESNVFHKVMAYRTSDGRDAILSASGTAAVLKLWRKEASGLQSTTLWKKDFGGKFSRMRDVEAGDIYSDGRVSLAVATHDQGVVATVHPDGKGGYEVKELDQQPNTFVHEIELGDLDGDGTLEIYATPSEPNRLDGRPQSGRVVRYVPAKGEGRVVVADLGHRHAKEILVRDVDGDGRDELYVVVEGVIDKASKRIVEPVEIRRYDQGTDATQGDVIARIDDRLGRFLTAGDLDGDGHEELVAALFSSGLWLLRPGADPHALWRKESIDRNSGGFEHASIITDLDGDGRAELYVASDNDSELRRYVWTNGKPVREVIYRRTGGGSVFTWNIMPIPVDLIP